MPRVTEAYRNEDFDPKILAEMVCRCRCVLIAQCRYKLMLLSHRENLVCSVLLLMDMDVLVYQVFHMV